nr:hypothetical protein [Sphingomonas pituitosa]
MGEVSPPQRSDGALTQREKTMLRLLLAGHTVNERLRDARRPLGGDGDAGPEPAGRAGIAHVPIVLKSRTLPGAGRRP